MSNLVRSRLSTIERDRFADLGRMLDVSFNEDSKTVETIVSIDRFADAAKRVAVAIAAIDGWRYVLEPIRGMTRTEVAAHAVVSKARKLAARRKWVLEENVLVPVVDHQAWRARARLDRDGRTVAVVLMSDDPEEAAPRAVAWAEKSRHPVVLLTLEKNHEITLAEVGSVPRVRVVKRHRSEQTAIKLVDSADALSLLDAA